MPKIVFVNRFYAPDTSATAQILTDLAEHLVAGGHRVEAIASRMRFDDPSCRLAGEEVVNGVRVVRVATTRFGRKAVVGRLVDYLSFYVATAFALLRHVARGDVVVAMTDPPLISILCTLAAGARGARTVNWLQDLYPEVAVAMGLFGKGGLLDRPLTAVRDWALRRAALNIAIGERMKELVLGRVPGARVAVVQNWSDDAGIKPISRADNGLRREWGFGDDQMVVGYSGNLGRAHDVDTFLAAARLLADRRDLRFLFIGGGHRTPYAQERVAAMGLGNVSFKPHQPRDQLAYSLGVADVHWLSLDPAFEGLIVPSKFFGIAAAGRPVLAVVDRQGELARFILRYDCGAVIEPGDGAAFAQALVRLVEDPAYRQRLGANARAMLEAGFQQSQALAALERLLVGVVAGGPGSQERARPMAARAMDASTRS